jgi:ubiquinone/menaquinone biosynthesis C-methylase UbiE
MVEQASARSFGRVFDEVAEEYDRSRPAYPDELIDAACQIAGIGSGDRVLEVGCGTGQLTGSLVDRGLDVTAVEPGKHLLSLARQKLDASGRVEFVNARFEDAPLPASRFRAVFSASAFHWIDPEIGWEKVARALVPGGTLALIQYCSLEEGQSIRDHRAVLSALSRHAPEIAVDWPPTRDLATIAAGVQERRENVSEVWAWIGHQDVAWRDAGRLFCDVQIASVPRLLEQTADELNRLLGTLSFYSRISPSQREALEREHVALHERLGRPIRSGTVAVLVTARRRSQA